jgi:hypothetical protein
MSTDFRISSGDGTARPVFDGIDLLPLDEALGTTVERTAYETANAEGAALFAALRAAEAAWTNAHPLADFAEDRTRWISERDIACRPLKAPLAPATAKSVASLRALYAAQRTALASDGVRARIATRYLEVDALATDFVARWDAAFVEREALGRLIVRGDGSGVAGRGHWSRSAELGTSVSLNAEGPRRAAELITRIAPRATVARLIEKA